MFQVVTQRNRRKTLKALRTNFRSLFIQTVSD